MKNNKKIIILGIIITLLVLALTLGILYLIYWNNNDTILEENNTTNEVTTDLSSGTSTTDLSSGTSTTINNNEEKTVTLYLFRGEGCSACKNTIANIEDIINDYPYLEVKTFEIWYNSTNKELATAVAEQFDISLTGVPFVVIGDYASIGISKSKLVEVIENAYEDDNYEDLVIDLINNYSDLEMGTI